MKQKHGFTIIEVILFLAISSALSALLMVGVGTAIARQQYNEATQSFSGFLKSEYSRVVNVENDREQGQTCPITGADAGATKRGQSECVVVGRYIRSDGPDGQNYKAYPVYAAENDLGAWRYGLGAEDTDYGVQWGAKTRLSTQSDGAANVSVIMYRDPTVGNLAIRTDSRQYSNSDISEFVSNEDTLDGNSRQICVYDTAWLSNERRSIFLGIRSGSGDAINVENASGECKNV